MVLDLAQVKLACPGPAGHKQSDTGPSENKTAVSDTTTFWIKVKVEQNVRDSQHRL